MSRPESGSEPPDLASLLSSRTPESFVDPDLKRSSPGPSAGPGSLRSIPVDEIEPNEFQPRRRFDEDEMVSLTDSVRALGVLQPVLVRPNGPGRYELIAGERRWRAARRAGLDEIPAVVRTADDRRSLEEAIVENLHRADLNAIEEAAAYQQLIEDFGLTQDDVAVRVGKSRSAVSNTLRLFQLPGVVQRQVANGDLSAGHARALLGLSDPMKQRDLADRVVAEGLTVRQVEDLVKGPAAGRDLKIGRGGRGESAPSKSATALEVEQVLADWLETGVTVEEPGGRISIRFADEADLARIMEILCREKPPAD